MPSSLHLVMPAVKLHLDGEMASPVVGRRFKSSATRRALVIVTCIVAGTLAVVCSLLAVVVALYDVRSVDLLPVDVAATPGAVERVPRIIHQTWKTDELPERWRNVSESCRAIHPSYEYRLWTDADGRELIRDHYPSFLATFDAYPYSIERVDAMRYFILRKFGGIYLDVDVGCRRSLDALLQYGSVLPYTKPVGVSNDFMMSAMEHPFMRYITEHLAEQSGSYGTKYPTVMFATGPMLVSRLYNRYVGELGSSSDPATAVRILPRPLYGKAQYSIDESSDPFFRHYFASSWHGSDAGAIAAIAVAWKWALLASGVGLALAVTRLVLGRIRRRQTSQYLAVPTTSPASPNMCAIASVTPPVLSPGSDSDESQGSVPTPVGSPRSAYVALDFDTLVSHTSPAVKA